MVTASTVERAAPDPTQFAALDRRFEAILFDWDGTAVRDRTADATRLRSLVEELCSLGLDLIVITGTHVGNVDGQLRARPRGPGRLIFCVNRGSEVFEADDDGLHLLERREATAVENAALDAAAEETVRELARRGVRAEIVSQRLNRRKIDLIPEPDWSDPPKARIAELLAAVKARLREAGLSDLRDAVEIAIDAARTAGIQEPRVTSDAKHVEIGLTDKADAARWAFADLWDRGIAPDLVLVAGDEFGPLGGLAGSDSFLLVREGADATAVSVGVEPTGVPPGVLALGGGPGAFLAILADQLERRRRWDVPDVAASDKWTLTVDGVDPELERVHESLLTQADGRLGTRGTPLAGNGATRPAVLCSGVYEGAGSEVALAHQPHWARFRPARALQPERRVLDLRTGILHEDGPLTGLRFTSLARPGTVALRVAAPAAVLPQPRLRHTRGAVAAALRDRRNGDVLERLGAYDPSDEAALTTLSAAQAAGFECLLTEQRRAWAQRWRQADVVIEGDPELQRAVRFSLFHLISSIADHGEAAVGARGLTGPGYRGHVFWDTDVFVLPFAAATHPAAARAMLEYRVRRLPAARETARRLGRSGARFPWESADTGFDVTPALVRLPTGAIARIRTGELEEHVVADVAWAAACYLDWTADAEFAAGPGAELLIETARYWASRVRFDRDGHAHIYGVIGPDEYHEPVDDNAFTNVIARWNLRRAASVERAPAEERAQWLGVAEALVDGYDSKKGVYEQFAGYFDLEPLLISQIAPRRPIAADLLLGHERTAQSQILKQADVLMLHQLVPDEVTPGSLIPNLDFYDPRTAHGSSLSPAIHASLLARAARFDEALAALRLAARLDLDDLTASTAGGLHLATMGGVWQALAFGFAGLRVTGEGLLVDPRLPHGWSALELGLRFRGVPFRLRVEHDGVRTDSEALKTVSTEGHWEVLVR